MPYSQADLDAVRANIASGVLKTRFADGREVTFQDLGALMKAEERIAAAIADATPGSRQRRRTAPYRNGC